MALEGYFLFQGDRTVCGGKIITGAEDTSGDLPYLWWHGRHVRSRRCKPPASRLHRKLQLLPVSGEIHSARFG